jgi:hypothetical protein
MNHCTATAWVLAFCLMISRGTGCSKKVFKIPFPEPQLEPVQEVVTPPPLLPEPAMIKTGG